MTFVDTNVLLDLVTDDPVWAEWSQEHLEAAALEGPLLADPMVYAELSVRYARVEAVDEFFAVAGITLVETPRAALFLAGKVFGRYRKAGGARTGVLPDFLIGAHAAVAGRPLLTRDRGRYTSYFPTVTLVAPSL
ncbi:type II toxin-antitoxin system VapC family toxin [Xanthobacter autotrophicus]|uniref:type II toxin-antitoxin system VapC family toxin n=1 Tax=Xanthobacter autotrophicus TaxID=280 RepID=UPI0024A76A7C|nr:type II toxin-antitoxin system VapC family toxin [Xanthobacter autotrophicus]MDI4655264.1 type II toxin-antitoxin system VapC family toxin [Xanthobacter autotrophicus]